MPTFSVGLDWAAPEGWMTFEAIDAPPRTDHSGFTSVRICRTFSG